MSESDEPSLTHDIDWPMLNKNRYVPLSLLSTFTVRSLLYPFTLVRTRLQVQIQSSIYKGTWHALTTTVRYEGFRSLYKGFLVYNCQLVPGLIYITTFEATRSHANILTRNNYLRAGIAGSIASLISQILACPIDVISQHMQLVGLTSPDKKFSEKKSQSRQIHRIHVPKEYRISNYLILKYICNTLLYENSKDNNNNQKFSFSLKGFYRGYFISTFLFSLTSAIWWPSYYFYQKQMFKIQTMFRKFEFFHLIKSMIFVYLANLFSVPVLVIQCIAGPLSSLTSTLLTNPLDVCRTRIQVEGKRRKVYHIMKELWQEERFNIFKKGLTARLSHACVYSLFIIFGYETVKRISLKEEYKQKVRW